MIIYEDDRKYQFTVMQSGRLWKVYFRRIAHKDMRMGWHPSQMAPWRDKEADAIEDMEQLALERGMTRKERLAEPRWEKRQ